MSSAGREAFPTFVNGQSAAIPGGLLPTDIVAIIRGAITYKITAANLAQALGGVLPIVTMTAGASAVLTDTNQYFAVNKTVGSATALTLTTPAAVGRFIEIADVKGDSETNPITVTPATGTIRGFPNWSINFNYQVSGFRYVATGLWIPE